MRSSIQKRFLEVQKLHPQLSTALCYGQVVAELNPTRNNIYRWFKILVDPNDYDPRDKKQFLNFLCKHAYRPQDQQ